IKLEEFNYIDFVIVLSEFAKQSCIEGGVPKEKIRLIQLGIENDFFAQKRVYRKEKFELLFVAGVRYLKGIKDLIEVFVELNLDNATLKIVGGEGNALSYIKEHLSFTIEYIPHLNHDELKKLYQESSIFVLPTYMDSFGQVIFEAMSCGTPVITTTHSGAPGIIIDNQNGFIISPNNQKALKEKILYFYHNRDEIERMGKNARKSVENLTWEKYYNEINAFIDNIKEKHSI
ncbi:MAG: glycosyltransferase family 4 protein, partial [Sulfurovaceae bacterium]|nr:glycosyltransferase family 4 protein [Sulfurovaceae bacterium]